METEPGKPVPLGATCVDGGINFALFSRHANAVKLCFLDVATKDVIAEFPVTHNTGHIWHIFVKDVPLPVLYGYYVDGSKEKPYLYNPQNLLSDPYAKEVLTTSKWADPSQPYFPYAYLCHPVPFDWQGVTSPKIPKRELVLYEMHVRGFTQDTSSGVSHPGTFLGLIEKIPHLLELGVNAVELMPIQEFNEREYKPDKNLYNYWGYSTVNFFAPMNRYAVENGVAEFKTMVRELHRNGIEVILDMVLNHTAEKSSPYSFKGIDRVTYYLLDDAGNDTNYSGCGHTMRLNHPVMRQFVRDCLHYWVTEMHVDGFRFDLGSIMNRDIHGKLLSQSSLIESLTFDPILADTKLIAEPWDCASAYQLGKFYPNEKRWKEWNGKFRDDIRKFVKNDPHSKNSASTRICGSEDLFHKRSPLASVNFITAHDGFTLADLVSYNQKHNLANGETNRDGSDYNLSWNCGEEGETDDLEIKAFRKKQMKNFLLILAISQGIPMFFMGDEYGHTRNGNNNPWCQDNPLNWFQWGRLAEEQEIFAFVKDLIAFRKEHPLLRYEHFLRKKQLVWHGEQPNHPNWVDGKNLLAFTLLDPDGVDHIYVALNAFHEDQELTLPTPPRGHQWAKVVDTSSVDNFSYEKLDTKTYPILQYSSLLLKVSRKG